VVAIEGVYCFAVEHQYLLAEEKMAERFPGLRVQRVNRLIQNKAINLINGHIEGHHEIKKQ